MQKDPEKVIGNYNEFYGAQPPVTLQRGIFQLLQQGEHRAREPQEIIQSGVKLVSDKINSLLETDNKLTRADLAFPAVRFIESSPERPNTAGYFDYRTNEIGIITDKIADDPTSQTKVFIHEYLHFLSHNGRAVDEQVNANSPLARNNNIGFQRFFGLDIRAGKEGSITTDYFLTFNEAVTEQLAIDILPGVHETYSNYRGLLNQVIADAVTRKLGSRNENDLFQPWSQEQIKNYIYGCFLKGDLIGFTALLKNIYKEYDISEQEFGLMTHRFDLPSVIKKQMDDDPKSPPSSPSRVAARVRERINSKTPDDYVTDVINLGPENGGTGAELLYGTEYDNYVKENGIMHASSETIEGMQYDFDNFGYTIYRGEDATALLDKIRTELDDLLAQNIDASLISERMDELLFDTHHMSMLSDGFRDFYIYKHSKIKWF